MPEHTNEPDLGAAPLVPWPIGLGCARSPANCECAAGPETLSGVLREFRTNRSSNLYQLSFDLPLLFVFLRHLNCGFTRQSLSDIAHLRREIELEGVDVVLIHMEDDASAQPKLAEFGLDDLPRVADPLRRLYRAFGLGCGTFLQLGPRVLWRALAAGVFGRRPDTASPDWSQMPGVFLVYRGEVHQRFKHNTARDRPNYVSLAAFPVLMGLFSDFQ